VREHKSLFCAGPVMEKKIQVFQSFEDADKADKEYYHSLTPQQRLQILYELNSRWPGNDGSSIRRLERVYRIIKLT